MVRRRGLKEGAVTITIVMMIVRPTYDSILVAPCVADVLFVGGMV